MPDPEIRLEFLGGDPHVIECSLCCNCVCCTPLKTISAMYINRMLPSQSYRHPRSSLGVFLTVLPCATMCLKPQTVAAQELHPAPLRFYTPTVPLVHDAYPVCERIRTGSIAERRCVCDGRVHASGKGSSSAFCFSCSSCQESLNVL